MSFCWSGELTVGLVAVPLYLMPAARPEHVSLNQLHSKCHQRLRQPMYCARCDEFVKSSDVEKAFEYSPGQYSMLTQEDVRAALPPSAQRIEIRSFIPERDLDPRYFDSCYLASTNADGLPDYESVWTALHAAVFPPFTSLCGMGKITLHNRESLAILRAAFDGLILQTLFYESEVRLSPYIDQVASGIRNSARPNPYLLELISNLRGRFTAEGQDGAACAIRNLVQYKEKNKT